jgi:hypothetical protein
MRHIPEGPKLSTTLSRVHNIFSACTAATATPSIFWLNLCHAFFLQSRLVSSYSIKYKQTTSCIVFGRLCCVYLRHCSLLHAALLSSVANAAHAPPLSLSLSLSLSLLSLSLSLSVPPPSQLGGGLHLNVTQCSPGRWQVKLCKAEIKLLSKAE